MSETPLIFRKYPDGDVIALFPTLPGGRFGECMSYVHVGQHGAGDYGHVIRTTRPARPDEYRDLQAELMRVGYDDLKVHPRDHPWMHRTRIDAHLETMRPPSRCSTAQER